MMAVIEAHFIRRKPTVAAKLTSEVQHLHDELPSSGNPFSADTVEVACTSFTSSHNMSYRSQLQMATWYVAADVRQESKQSL
jgi:hypothetical protein